MCRWSASFVSVNFFCYAPFSSQVGFSYSQSIYWSSKNASHRHTLAEEDRKRQDRVWFCWHVLVHGHRNVSAPRALDHLSEIRLKCWSVSLAYYRYNHVNESFMWQNQNNVYQAPHKNSAKYTNPLSVY